MKHTLKLYTVAFALTLLLALTTLPAAAAPRGEAGWNWLSWLWSWVAERVAPVAQGREVGSPWHVVEAKAGGMFDPDGRARSTSCTAGAGQGATLQQ